MCKCGNILGFWDGIWLAVSMALNNYSLSILCWRMRGIDYLYLIDLLSEGYNGGKEILGRPLQIPALIMRPV
jgi:hypothetical protein